MCRLGFGVFAADENRAQVIIFLGIEVMNTIISENRCLILIAKTMFNVLRRVVKPTINNVYVALHEKYTRSTMPIIKPSRSSL